MQSQDLAPPTWAGKQQPQKITTRRSRVPLSCDPCRTRKLKCNREKPCQNCTARSEQASCNFRGPKNGAGTLPNGRRSADEEVLRQRIDHLEGLVKRLVGERQQALSMNNSPTHTAHASESSGSSRSEPETGLAAPAPVRNAVVGIDRDSDRSVHLDANDWHAVLEEIKEIKRSWNQDLDDQSDYSVRDILSHTVDGTSLLFHQVKAIDRIEILSSLPPKPTADRLIARFFDRETFPITLPPILHQPTFMREYNAQWTSPSQTNFIWLGLLYSILSSTMLAFHQYGEPPEYEGLSESLFQLYRMRTAQCLLIGDIAKCLPYTVEALRLNATAELNRRDDNRRGLWIMTGVVVRAAINMGYHRDPGPHVPVLEAEYRRRTWLSVISMDDMASFAGGFPRTASSVYSDTLEPRNLHDWELGEGTTVLPPSRPLTERTAASYLIIKGRLFRVLGRVADFNSAPSLGSYQTVLEIDQALYDVYANFPPHLHVIRSVNGIYQPGRNVVNHSNLSLLMSYHRGMCTLHRRFLAEGRDDVRFQVSRDRCISSALALLDLQDVLGGVYYKISQIRQVLTLAAMILFLELELRRRDSQIGGAQAPESAVLIRALEKSCARLAEAKDTTDEARKIHQLLAGMLSSFSSVENGSAVEPAHAAPSQTPFEPSILSPRFDVANGTFSLEKDMTEGGFDWTAYDNFLAEAEHDVGPIY